MPPVSVYMIRFSLVWMLLGATVGAMIPTGWLPGLHARPLALHQFLMMFGWMLQFTIAVAWWMFPRLGRNKRPSDTPVWITGTFFQLAVVLMLLWPSQQPVAHLLLFTGSLIFILSVIKRVKPLGKKS